MQGVNENEEKSDDENGDDGKKMILVVKEKREILVLDIREGGIKWPLLLQWGRRDDHFAALIAFQRENCAG